MAQLNVYLHFDGNCRAAMNFYKECLGGELSLQTAGESPMGEQTADEEKQKIIHSSLTNNSLVLLACDGFGPEGIIRGNTVTLCLDCSSEEEINTFFANLSAGGQVTHALKTEFWGGTFGQLTDKFGVNWMLNYSPNAQA